MLSKRYIFTSIFVAVRCTALPSLANGRVEYGRGHWAGYYPLWTFASFYCNSNYQLVGRLFRRCESNGQWGGDQPTCEGKRNNYSTLISFTLSQLTCTSKWNSFYH